uniref:Uncharacterized protein n=1 Tax=Anguilla anguilla TaxID=7936 RepID=A0A0E9W905_ANGAN
MVSIGPVSNIISSNPASYIRGTLGCFLPSMEVRGQGLGRRRR